MNLIVRQLALVAALVAAAVSFLPQPAAAAGGEALQRDAKAALNDLYAKNPAARGLQKQAAAILVFRCRLGNGLGNYRRAQREGRGQPSQAPRELRGGMLCIRRPVRHYVSRSRSFCW